jgi:hypothetical protein
VYVRSRLSSLSEVVCLLSVRWFGDAAGMTAHIFTAIKCILFDSCSLAGVELTQKRGRDLLDKHLLGLCVVDE